MTPCPPAFCRTGRWGLFLTARFVAVSAWASPPPADSRGFVGEISADVAACAVRPQVATANRAAIEARAELLQRVLRDIAHPLLLLRSAHGRACACSAAAGQRREAVSDSGKGPQPGGRLADFRTAQSRCATNRGGSVFHDRMRGSCASNPRSASCNTRAMREAHAPGRPPRAPGPDVFQSRHAADARASRVVRDGVIGLVADEVGFVVGDDQIAVLAAASRAPGRQSADRGCTTPRRASRVARLGRRRSWCAATPRLARPASPVAHPAIRAMRRW